MRAKGCAEDGVKLTAAHVNNADNVSKLVKSDHAFKVFKNI